MNHLIIVIIFINLSPAHKGTVIADNPILCHIRHHALVKIKRCIIIHVLDFSTSPVSNFGVYGTIYRLVSMNFANITLGINKIIRGSASAILKYQRSCRTVFQVQEHHGLRICSRREIGPRNCCMSGTSKHENVLSTKRSRRIIEQVNSLIFVRKFYDQVTIIQFFFVTALIVFNSL